MRNYVLVLIVIDLLTRIDQFGFKFFDLLLFAFKKRLRHSFVFGLEKKTLDLIEKLH